MSRRGTTNMVPRATVLLLAAVLLAAPGSALGAPPDGRPPAQERDQIRLPEDDGPPPAPLAPRHREWLEKDVAYIISPVEEEVFERLSSDEERDLFIEAFWRTRDPTPGTVRNEFEERHYRRIEYANRYLGRETPREGWMTDRGRTYIRLGEPMEIQRYPDPRQFWPMELWVYQADPTATGLPSHFYMLFFRPNQGAEFRLYDPGSDGPEQLAKQITLSNAPLRRIVRELRVNLGGEVAHATLNMNAAEPTSWSDPRISAGNSMVMRWIQEAPYRSVDTAYAPRFLAHRGDVEAMVDFVTVPVQMKAYGLWDERGMPFLHYVVQIPADRVMLGQYEDDYYVSLGISVEVDDLRDRTVESLSQDMEQHFDEEKKEQVIRAPLAYYDRVDLVPGIYDLSVRLDNKVSKERSIATARIRIPRPTGAWTLSDLLVAGAAVPARTADDEVAPRAFRFADRQYVPRVEEELPVGSEAILFAQLVAGESAPAQARLVPAASLVAADGTVVKRVEGVAITTRPAPAPTMLEVRLPLEGVPPGAYRARLEAEVAGSGTLQVDAPLQVVEAQGQALVPQLLMAGEAPPGDPREYALRAEQHRRVGQDDAAVTYLEAGLERFPDDATLRRTLARVLARRGQEGRAVELLRGLASAGIAEEEDLLLLSSLLRRGGRAGEAEEVVRQLLRRQPTSVAWNELARVLLALGKIQDAAGAYRASLQLDPDQPDVRAELERLETS